MSQSFETPHPETGPKDHDVLRHWQQTITQRPRLTVVRSGQRTARTLGERVSSRVGAEVEVEPEAVAQVDPVEACLGRVARGRREGVSLDGAHAEPGALVEAEVVDVGGGGGDCERRALPLLGALDSCSDERMADSAAAMCGIHSHVLDLDLSCLGGVDEL